MTLTAIFIIIAFIFELLAGFNVQAYRRAPGAAGAQVQINFLALGLGFFFLSFLFLGHTPVIR